MRFVAIHLRGRSPFAERVSESVSSTSYDAVVSAVVSAVGRAKWRK